ncbi:hypothetical protein FGO68_gene17587 [Halteria grandinella]|uniref:Uncharacterized protein n=1 Tax=Halteria grandinella TaxID=5974 RepID=A0A8J8T301_HALGN|nr:hypothetical protein FGO68_gene17587 [Halteria grandinella]
MGRDYKIFIRVIPYMRFEQAESGMSQLQGACGVARFTHYDQVGFRGLFFILWLWIIRFLKWTEFRLGNQIVLLARLQAVQLIATL